MNKSAPNPAKRSPHSKGKGSLGGSSRVHPHTMKALNAVAINSGFKKYAVGTGNGLSTRDTRY